MRTAYTRARDIIMGDIIKHWSFGVRMVMRTWQSSPQSEFIHINCRSSKGDTIGPVFKLTDPVGTFIPDPGETLQDADAYYDRPIGTDVRNATM